MARPIPIEFSGALYQVTSRGDRREDTYDGDMDRELFLDVIEQVVDGWNWVCDTYCLMSVHYHLVIEMPDGNLSNGMRQLNGVYTLSSNRRHRRIDHLFQGLYKGILVDAEAYLLELIRYVMLEQL